MSTVGPDPLALAGVADAPSILARAAQERPAWELEPGVVHVAGGAACRRVLLDPRGFSSDGAAFGPVGLAGPAAPAKTMNAADPPDHGRLRGLVAPWFTRPAVNAGISRMEALAEALLAPLVDRGSFDAVGDFASPFVLGVLAGILGLPDGLEPDLRNLADTITAPDGRSDVERARRELGELFSDVLSTPDRLAPDSALRHMAGSHAGGLLTFDELIAQCTLLVVAGSETTRNLLAAGLLTLAEDEALLATLREDPSTIAPFVEEALRFHSSVQAAVRYTTQQVSLENLVLPPKCPVFVWVSAANRDRSVHPGPDRFDPTRGPRHLAFGLGIHTCLGAHLARTELGIAFAAIARAVEDLRPLGADVAWLNSPLARGPVSLPLSCRPVA